MTFLPKSGYGRLFSKTNVGFLQGKLKGNSKKKQNLMEISNCHDFFAKIRFRRTIFKGKCRLFTRKIERKRENKAYYLGYFDGNFQFSWLFCQNTLRANLKFNPKVVFHVEFHGIFFVFLSKIWNSADFFAWIRL